MEGDAMSWLSNSFPEHLLCATYCAIHQGYRVKLSEFYNQGAQNGAAGYVEGKTVAKQV